MYHNASNVFFVDDPLTAKNAKSSDSSSNVCLTVDVLSTATQATEIIKQLTDVFFLNKLSMALQSEQGFENANFNRELVPSIETSPQQQASDFSKNQMTEEPTSAPVTRFNQVMHVKMLQNAFS